MPATAGPIVRAPLNIIEFSAIAFGRSSIPTISTTNACRPGMSNELTIPLKAARITTCATRTVPVKVNAASTNALSISSTCATIIRRRRST